MGLAVADGLASWVGLGEAAMIWTVHLARASATRVVPVVSYRVTVTVWAPSSENAWLASDSCGSS